MYRGYFISLNAGKVFWTSAKKLYGGYGKEKESLCFVPVHPPQSVKLGTFTLCRAHAK